MGSFFNIGGCYYTPTILPLPRYNFSLSYSSNFIEKSTKKSDEEEFNQKKMIIQPSQLIFTYLLNSLVISSSFSPSFNANSISYFSSPFSSSFFLLLTFFPSIPSNEKRSILKNIKE